MELLRFFLSYWIRTVQTVRAFSKAVLMILLRKLHNWNLMFWVYLENINRALDVSTEAEKNSVDDFGNHISTVYFRPSRCFSKQFQMNIKCTLQTISLYSLNTSFKRLLQKLQKQKRYQCTVTTEEALRGCFQLCSKVLQMQYSVFTSAEWEQRKLSPCNTLTV